MEFYGIYRECSVLNKYKKIEKKKAIYTNSKISEPQKTELRKEITTIFNRLSPKEKNEVIEFLYPVLRDNVSEAFSSNNYKGITSAFEVIQNTQRWKKEYKTNKIIMINMLVFSYLFLHIEQESGNDENFLIAKELFEEICKYNFEEIEFNDEQLENEVYNFKRNKAFISAIENNDIWTSVTYEIPFPLYISNNQLSFHYKGTKVLMEAEIISNGKPTIVAENGFVDLEKDKYGILNRTIVILKINKYLSSSKNINIYTADGVEKRSVALVISLELINFIIKNYKSISQNYWIENVSFKMIQASAPKIFAGETELKNILFYDENKYRVSPHIPYLSDELIKEFLIQLNNSYNENLWNILLQDAKKYLLINNLREAIISLNSSFENFMYSKIKLILKKYMGEEKTQLFFDGKVSYEDHASHEFITEEQFNKLVDRKIINNHIPSIYQLVKEYYKHVPSDKRIVLSRRKFNSYINKIKENRNDIVHGNKVDELSSKSVKEAIEAFEEIAHEILETHF
ncbi:hypothetical protein ABZ530_02045 [Micrococcus luteus]|uniref:hypothetical protein n=1 Tax=Micrococcus luteus TaxID=1270 RepID=UPI0033E11E0E